MNANHIYNFAKSNSQTNMELPSNLSSSQKGELMDQVKQQIAVSIIQEHKSSDEIFEVYIEILFL